MYKTVFLLLVITCSCNQSPHSKNDVTNSIDTTTSHHSEILSDVQDSSNQDIYDFMKIVIANQKLNSNYGLTIEPEAGCDLSGNDNEFLKTLLIEKEIKNEKVDTGDWRNISITLADVNKCLTTNDIKTMLEQKKRLFSFKWDNRRLGFNLSNRDNWYCFSIPLFSKDKTKVVMMIRDLCKGLCGSGSTIVFSKAKGKWSSQSLGIWYH